ncbi:hypothetical protein Tco_0071751 [Tanacetum coccineum]
MITFSSLYDNDRQYTKQIKEQEDLIDTMSDQLAEEKNTVMIQQTTISNLEECLRKKDSENEHLKSKSKVADCTMCQNLQVQIEELKNVNESLNSSVEELYKARELTEATLRERDEMIFAQCEKIRLLEHSETFHEVQSEFDSEKVHDTQDNSEKDLILMSSSVQKEYNDLLASNDVLRQSLETKFKFLKHDNSLEKMIEMIEKENESNVSKISITNSTLENKNLELVKEMGDKMKCFDEEKKVFENKISKLEMF